MYILSPTPMNVPNETALRNVKNLNSTNAKLIEDVCETQ